MAEVTDTTETEAEVEEPTTFSPKHVADRLNIDAKAFRRWLRRQTDQRAGKGGRWTFSADDVEALVTAYNAPPKAEPEVNDEPEAEDELNDELAELDG